MRFDEPNRNRIMDAIAFFRASGWTLAQAIGLVGNLQAEAKVEPTQGQYGGGPGYGIAQWEGPRQAAFKAWAGIDIRGSTLDLQLRFVQHELETSERRAAALLRAALTPADAARVVCRYYERPADTEGQCVYRAQVADAIAALVPDFSNVEGASSSTAPSPNP